VLEVFARLAQSTDGPPSVDIHDILGNDDHVVVLGSASATARDGSSAEWKYTQIFHIRDGRTTKVWGMAENDAADWAQLRSRSSGRRPSATAAGSVR
jgi:hypothetical protein